ncbi:MAG: hypothetical protein LBB53_01210 [Prevotellaceae bacterium]|jgi:hypothetical protein|nr:hypothetical protein [Prevotellaceae bacterium]
MKKLYIFNPEHELALVNNDINYMPKSNIAQMIRDLTVLPLWFNSDCYLKDSYVNDEWKKNAEKLNLHYWLVDEINYKNVTELNVWGWNRTVCNILKNKGINTNFLPNDEQLARIRDLTNRQTAIAAFLFLKQKMPAYHFPETPLALTSEYLVRKFLHRRFKSVLKTPFSCSGKGIFINQQVTKKFKEFTQSVIKEQKCMIAEEYLEVIQNFAMEFQITDNQVYFVGYSLFETNGKAYAENVLMPDGEIEFFLEKFISKDLLNTVKQAFIEFIEQKIIPDYNGFLGVDMFVYEKNNSFLLNPCVEINLRPTMGLAAHEFYKNFVNSNKKGVFAIDFFKNSEELFFDHQKRFAENPPIFENSRLLSGYISLCPVFENTFFRIRVEIDK